MQITWSLVLLAAIGLMGMLAGCQASAPSAAAGTAGAAAKLPATTQTSTEPAIPAHTHTRDVIYGRKYGTCLTFDVFRPEHPNGAAIIALDTGSWADDHDHIWAGGYVYYLQRGYTVFHVVHGSVPKFTIAEQISDVQRAIKFIRYHAADYGIDPQRLGITGSSAGGHLAVMMGVTDAADPQAADPIEHQSSRAQVVGCFCPPTDLTKRRPGSASATGPTTAADDAPRLGGYSFLTFMEKPRSRLMMGAAASPGTGPKIVPLVTDPQQTQAILRAISPIEQVTAAAAPTMVIQGELDKAVPLENTQRFLAKLREAGVATNLIVVPGAGHGIPNAQARRADLAEWFDRYLQRPAGASH